MSEVETGSCYGFIEWLFVLLGGIWIIFEGLLQGAIILVILICFVLWAWALFRMGQFLVESMAKGEIEEEENEVIDKK